MIFPYNANGITDFHILLWVAEQVADHADATRIRQLDKHDKIWPTLLQCFMDGMPDALEGVDFAAP